MAKHNYLITGLPGTGKTTVQEELKSRGYNAVDADKAFGFRGDPVTGEPTTDKNQLHWLWDEQKLERILDDLSEDKVYICGSASNRGRFLNRFSKVFVLQVDDETLKQRILTRTSHDFGKDPVVLARQLEHNQGVSTYAQKNGMILVDANRPIQKVVDEILKHKVQKEGLEGSTSKLIKDDRGASRGQ